MAATLLALRRASVPPALFLARSSPVGGRAFSTSPSHRAGKAKQLCGSAPAYARHLVVHGQSSENWPSHIEAVSPLARALGALGSKPGLAAVGVTFGERADGCVLQAEEKRWDAQRSKFDQLPEAEASVETYSGVLYPDFIKLDDISLATLPSIAGQIAALPAPAALAAQPTGPAKAAIYVCTHGTRDCRCGDIGEPLWAALVEEAERKGLGGAMGEGEDGVRIGRISHVGGHVWAANALVYRADGRCDWYGLLRESDAGALLALATAKEHKTWYSRWRGRLGLTPEQCQAELAEAMEREAQGSGSTPARKREQLAPKPLGDPVKLVFRTWEGEELTVTGYEGESLMETARRNEMESILATCGGHCECATCHVHLASVTSPPTVAVVGGRQPLGIAQAAPVEEMADEEDEQLDFALGRKDDSRLSCQIAVTKELGQWCANGGRIGLPQY